MSKYEKYKSSNIESIGVVPDHWNVVRLKKVIKEKITDGPHETPDFIDDGIPFLSVDGIQDGELIFEGCRYISPEAHCEYQKKCIVEKDDVLMGKAASTGKIARVKVDFEFNIWSPLALIKPNRNRITPTFLEYSLKSDFGQIQIDLLCTSNTQKNISMDDIPKLSICQPPLEEQLTIANYLDNQTQKIDRLIANKKAQAEKLKELRQIEINNAVTKGLNPIAEMKDSGIEWLGEIPKHWEEKRLKNLVSPKITDGPHETPELVDDLDGIPFISAEAITENGINYDARGGNISVEQDRIYSLKCKPKRDDIFMVKSGSTTGRIGYVDSDLNFNIWSPLALIRSNSNTHSRYLYFALCSNYIQKQVQLTWSFGTQPNIGMGVIERLRVVIAPKSEQIEIAKYLQERTTAIDKLIKNIDAQIEKLQDLRKIKIYEAVTGKIKVNAYVEATA
jgi:type I restriction enzyme S subunit